MPAKSVFFFYFVLGGGGELQPGSPLFDARLGWMIRVQICVGAINVLYLQNIGISCEALITFRSVGTGFFLRGDKMISA